MENVEILRRWHDAWNRGDLDTVADLFHPNAEVIPDPSWMEPGPFKGRTAIRSWYEGLRESWGGRDEAVVRELFEASGQVVSRFDWEVRGRASGIDTRLDLTAVNLVEAGRIVRQQYYFDHAEALKAVGWRSRRPRRRARESANTRSATVAGAARKRSAPRGPTDREGMVGKLKLIRRCR